MAAKTSEPGFAHCPLRTLNRTITFLGEPGADPL